MEMLQNDIHWHCAEVETELANQMDKLNEKRAQLQQVTDKLQGCIFIPDVFLVIPCIFTRLCLKCMQMCMCVCLFVHAVIVCLFTRV